MQSAIHSQHATVCYVRMYMLSNDIQFPICCCMLYSSLFAALCRAVAINFVAACCTVYYLLPYTIQFAIHYNMLQSLLFLEHAGQFNTCLTVCYEFLHTYMLYSLLFAAACHAVCYMFYSSLFVSACCTVTCLSPCAAQLVVCHCTVQHNLGEIGHSKLLNNWEY